MIEKHERDLLALSRGDRWLVALFMPIPICPFAFLVYATQMIEVSSFMGRILKWLLLEFFVTCDVFCVAGFVWAAFRPKCVEPILAAAKRNLGRWALSGFCVMLVGTVVLTAFVGLIKFLGW